jgi:GH18 family chitinase
MLKENSWAFSTEAPTYTIFRSGVTPANRQTFANNVVNFINTHGLEGVDFDWEYPSAPDIPGIPPGQSQEGQDYLEFITLVKAQLPNKSVSIAAPASYWYLKGFPIEEIGAVVDYMVYMTYDLHGQWDYGNKWSSPGCEEGDCLRSHINKTETYSSLSMITKAGVPSHKIFAGISSYGRSFKMAQAGCTGPMCRFTGSASVSNAAKGACTDTGGYIASAEIRDIINQGGNINTFYDEPSDSDILVYQDTEWVAWMNDETKANRVAWYRSLNLGGVSDWAVDLDAGGDPVRHVSPASATVIPFPATTVAPSATFTAGGAVATDINNLQNQGQQNRPSGPGANQCPVSILKQEPYLNFYPVSILTNRLFSCSYATLPD